MDLGERLMTGAGKEQTNCPDKMARILGISVPASWDLCPQASCALARLGLVLFRAKHGFGQFWRGLAPFFFFFFSFFLNQLILQRCGCFKVE